MAGCLVRLRGDFTLLCSISMRDGSEALTGGLMPSLEVQNVLYWCVWVSASWRFSSNVPVDSVVTVVVFPI